MDVVSRRSGGVDLCSLGYRWICGYVDLLLWISRSVGLWICAVFQRTPPRTPIFSPATPVIPPKHTSMSHPHPQCHSFVIDSLACSNSEQFRAQIGTLKRIPYQVKANLSSNPKRPPKWF